MGIRLLGDLPVDVLLAEGEMIIGDADTFTVLYHQAFVPMGVLTGRLVLTARLAKPWFKASHEAEGHAAEEALAADPEQEEGAISQPEAMQAGA